MKEKEIARLLSGGRTPAELIRDGYSRSTVYKIAKRVAGGGTSKGSGQSGFVGVGLDPEIESDPEILEFKKRLRKAQLERAIAEVRAPMDLGGRVRTLEKTVGELTELVLDLVEED